MDLTSALRSARRILSAQQVFGRPVEHDGVIVIPAATVIGGGGGGFGEAQGGAGGDLNATGGLSGSVSGGLSGSAEVVPGGARGVGRGGGGAGGRGGGGAEGAANAGGTAGGGGFGVRAHPAGAFVIRDGDVRWVPALDPNRIVVAATVVATAFVVMRGLNRLFHRHH